MTRRRRKVGDVYQFQLSEGRYAYGRVLEDACVAFYREITASPAEPPIGSRDYQFVVGVYRHVFRADGVTFVGHDKSRDETDDWPPPMKITDPLTGSLSIYERGQIRPAGTENCDELEPAGVWDLPQLLSRLEGQGSAQQ
ncbi:Imm26 family immunity protein [Aeromicrobium sp. UC242_57]|uniref:Imm26 family immunity protein n=1 Tax=Aeromicrobium sp. UC242_57 TaxID=3374624 RepID=UPI0037B5EEC2